MTSGLADGFWWLVNWELRIILPLGDRKSWNRHTLRTMSFYERSIPEVVDDSTPWGRVMLNFPGLHLVDVNQCRNVPALESPEEEMAALNALSRESLSGGDWVRRYAYCEAFLRISEVVAKKYGDPTEQWVGLPGAPAAATMAANGAEDHA